MSKLGKMLCLVLLAGCTSSPGHRPPAVAAEYVHLPAPCVQICELQRLGRLAGECGDRDYQRYRSFGAGCMIAEPGRSRVALAPRSFGAVR